MRPRGGGTKSLHLFFGRRPLGFRQMTPTPPPQPNAPDPLAGAMDGLTWSTLLGRWMEFARASVALPPDAEGDRWRRAVAPVIGLQAIAFALTDLARVAPEERPLALERAEAGLREYAGALHHLWAAEPLPAPIAEVIDDARSALQLAASGGEEQSVDRDDFIAPDPTPMARAMVDAGFKGDLWAATPGTRLAPGAPAAFARPDFRGVRWPGCAAPHWSPQPQLYRQVDDAGQVVGDLVAPLEAGLPPGRPLLRLVIERGRLSHTPDAEAQRSWEDAQRRAGVFDHPPSLLSPEGGEGDGAGGSVERG